MPGVFLIVFPWSFLFVNFWLLGHLLVLTCIMKSWVFSQMSIKMSTVSALRPGNLHALFHKVSPFSRAVEFFILKSCLFLSLSLCKQNLCNTVQEQEAGTEVHFYQTEIYSLWMDAQVVFALLLRASASAWATGVWYCWLVIPGWVLLPYKWELHEGREKWVGEKRSSLFQSAWNSASVRPRNWGRWEKLTVCPSQLYSCLSLYSSTQGARGTGSPHLLDHTHLD